MAIDSMKPMSAAEVAVGRTRVSSAMLSVPDHGGSPSGMAPTILTPYGCSASTGQISSMQMPSRHVISGPSGRMNERRGYLVAM